MVGLLGPILVDKITSETDKGKVGIGGSKVFDTIDHIIMLDKLFMCDVRGKVLNWMRIINRIENNMLFYIESNQTAVIKCGVPQGTILGPLLFIIYITIW
jgi:Reverse transcriptase (RNA-dependent DNA polymerase)